MASSVRIELFSLSIFELNAPTSAQQFQRFEYSQVYKCVLMNIFIGSLHNVLVIGMMRIDSLTYDELQRQDADKMGIYCQSLKHH